MTDALDRLLGRYPCLIGEDEDDSRPLPSHPSGRPTGMRKKNSNAVDRARLEQRLPALKRGRR
jgi:hypothetical protein